MKKFLTECTISELVNAINRFEGYGVEILKIGVDPTGDYYYQGDGDLCETFYANIIDDEGKEIVMEYEWDTEEGMVTTAMECKK